MFIVEVDISRLLSKIKDSGTLINDLSASSGGNGLSDGWLAIVGVVAVVVVEIVLVLLVVGVTVSGESASGVSPASSDCEKHAPLQQARAASLTVGRRIQNLRESPARSMATNGDERRVVAITTIVDKNRRRRPRLAHCSAAASQPLLQHASVLLFGAPLASSVARRCSTSFSIASTRVCESGVSV